jgi:hypothetical protein
VTRESPKNIHSKAERAALQLLSNRDAGIGEAAVLRHRIDELIEQLDSVGEQYATALAKLRDNGWSNDELRQLGLTEAPAPSANGRRRPARPVPAPRTPEDASPTATDGSPAPSTATPA